MREKKRYLLVQPDGVAVQDAKRAVEAALLEWLGEKGMFDARARVIRVESNGQVWVRCSTKAMEDTVAALALKRFSGETDVALRVVKAAGSVPSIRMPKRGRKAA
ncbi:MAG: Rpp14/Pop5 family protein [Candidatus Micrarchaeota archaeon]|nr:Rpp14/Pop5 family protein [Candidatus Micrarchaeota archaeon]